MIFAKNDLYIKATFHPESSDLSDLEVLVLLVGGISALVGWARWYNDLLRVTRLGSSAAQRLALALAPFLYLVLITVVLECCSAPSVRNDPFWIFYYVVVGAGWLSLCMWLLPFLGISTRDDIVERHNGAALWAILGGLAGFTACFAGSNVGDGPGVQVVLITLALSAGTYIFLWVLLEVLSGHRILEAITIGRSEMTGIRMGCYLLAMGIVLGAAAAGDWAPERLLFDFAIAGWPALAVFVFAAIVERCRWSGMLATLTVSAACIATSVAVLLHRSSQL